ncbi:DUF2325 domain-containing protein [Desulfonema magnum]|uniref:DUF2325 n=1 Tax=Desulfonema magnum TaxID=45655 RepID=A0A975BK56_9BACT|nr:DUF2325 domain-containing protein [Desulfonema magnum]QTA86986.1 DUF2325 [Desulfonema magnum]
MKSFKNEEVRPNFIWEIHPHFKCPVIGACLSIAEHRKLIKKLGYQTKRLTSYELHRIIMEHMNKENRVSLKVERYLRHKYQNSVSSLFDLDADQFMEEWRNAFRQGDLDGPFYVAAIRKNLSEEHLKEIFGEIHMLSHAHLAEVMQARRDLTLQQKANEKLARLLNREKESHKKAKKENSNLKDALHDMRCFTEKRNSFSQDRVLKEKRVRDLEAENIALREKVREADKAVSDRTMRLELENQRLRTQISDMKTANHGLANEMSGLISQLSGFIRCEDGCNEECPRFRICAKRILIVGGITRIKHLYRHLIESAGGEFDYHDGYMRNGKENLEVRVRRSDLIICPVDCNSHGAALKVKKLCRKHNKTVRMLPSSSLSAISGALFDVAESVKN